KDTKEFNMSLFSDQVIFRYDKTNQVIPVVPTTQQVFGSWGNLIIPPGTYEYNGQFYNLVEEGLYALFNPGIDGGFRIVYQNQPEKLLEAICHLCAYGRWDEGFSYSQLAAKAKTTKLAMRCGDTVTFTASILNQYGILNRRVRLLTAETPNGYDNGHQALEVYYSDRWNFWDITNDCTFHLGTISNPPLNLKGLVVDVGITNQDLKVQFHANPECDLYGA